MSGMKWKSFISFSLVASQVVFPPFVSLQHPFIFCTFRFASTSVYLCAFCHRSLYLQPLDDTRIMESSWSHYIEHFSSFLKHHCWSRFHCFVKILFFQVICFHPNPKLSLPLMSVEEIERVIERWQIELQELSKNFVYVQIFENKGELMGCSNPHPHCQIWATSFLPNEIVKENNCQDQYFKRKNKVLLEQYRDKELFSARNCKDPGSNRVVLENDDWLVLVS